jgi:hypothetical protein
MRRRFERGQTPRGRHCARCQPPRIAPLPTLPQQVECASKGKLDAELLGEISYLQEYVLSLLELSGGVRDSEIELNEDVEAALSEIVEADQCRFCWSSDDR